MKKFIIAGATLLMLGGCHHSSTGNNVGDVEPQKLEGPSSSQPDCGSVEGQQLVVDIAKQQSTLVSFLRSRGDGPANPNTRDYSDPETDRIGSEIQKASEQVQQLVKQCLAVVTPGSGNERYCTDGYLSFGTKGNPSSDIHFDSIVPLTRTISELENKRDRYKADLANKKFEILLPGLKYSLSNIIMTSKNEQTGAVQCKAALGAEITDWGQAGQDITYQIEKTTDGKLVATVYGL
jgi:hypothetical protein